MSTSANPYAAPQSDVNAEASGPGGSLEDALAGRYDFTMGEVFEDAWRLTKGFKLTYWGANILVGVASGIVSALMGAVLGMLKAGTAGVVLVQVVSFAMAFILTVGTMMLSVRRAAGLQVSVGTAFNYFDRWVAALVGGFLMVLMIMLGTVLLVIPGIYLGVCYYLAFPLIGDRRLGGWAALETSRKAVTHKWFKVFGTLLVAGLLTLLSAVLIIPLIWTAPWLAMVLGVLYRRIFGVASTT